MTQSDGEGAVGLRAGVGFRVFLAAAAIPALLLAQPTRAESGTHGDWLERSHLTGDWGGARETLACLGIAPWGRYSSGFWSNVRGGFETGTRYEGFAEWGLDVELEPLLGWRGGSFHINWYSYHGGQPSEDLVGPFPTQTVSGNETAETVRFYEIFVKQELLDDRLQVEIGQIVGEDEFFVTKHSQALLNGTFGFLGVGRAREVTPFYPLAVPGVQFHAFSGDDHWELLGGVYVSDVGEDERSNFGFDYSFDGGATLLGEIAANRRPFDRPGRYTLGVVGSTGSEDRLKDDRSVDGGYALYGAIDQVVVEQENGRPGLGFFVRSYGSPKIERNFLHWYVDFGTMLTRPFPGRDGDVFSLGFAVLGFSDDYVDAARDDGEDVSRHQSVLEVTYRFQVSGWLTLQPNFQFFFDPNLSRRDATVIGLRAVIDL